MRRLKFFLVLFALNSINYICISQNEMFYDDLLRDIQKIEKKTIQVNKLRLKKRLNNRVFISKAKLDSGKIEFYSKIKYFKGGMKKELIKYYILPKNVLILEIVKINDKYNFIKYFEYDKDYGDNFILRKKEILIDNMYYLIKIFDNTGRLVNEKKEIITKNKTSL